MPISLPLHLPSNNVWREAGADARKCISDLPNYPIVPATDDSANAGVIGTNITIPHQKANCACIFFIINADATLFFPTRKGIAARLNQARFLSKHRIHEMALRDLITCKRSLP